tara:strand:+ start:1634 stop:2476 length:843 start_codon:yes stop_codon:yes gene_type:complete
MIRIDEITRGRFGNRILQYNTLMQLSFTTNNDASCVRWEGHDIFSNLVNRKSGGNSEKSSIIWSDLLEDLHLDSDKDYCICPNSIHNVFWKVTKTDPRKFIQINDKYKRNLPEDKTNVGIHIRGDDILGRDGNNGREIHSPEYYRTAINTVEDEFDNTFYYVCTDDKSFESYVRTVEYLKERGLNFELGSPDHFKDFSTLTECDVLIASSSTFVVCAGFVGKNDKKIIHSLEWIEKNLNHTPWHLTEDPEHVRKWQLSYDNFWTDLYKGGNEYYNVWRFV